MSEMQISLLGQRKKMREKELENKLEKNLNRIEPGLNLVERQKKVDIGIIDLFCKDRNDKYIIIKLKIKANTNAIVQLVKYNMALIKNIFNKKRLRAILVAPKLSKSVKATCDFFNFEIKNIYKERTMVKKRRSKQSKNAK